MRRRNVVSASLGAIAALMLGSLAAAGPEWVERMDAGGLPGSAQNTMGEGPLDQLTGGLSPGLFGRDTEDMYFIRVTDPENFSAQTIGGGMASFDSQLWIFRIVLGARGHIFGLGLLANDDVDDGISGSRILPDSTDDSGARLTEKGLYLIAITRFDNDPFSDKGEQGRIFFQEFRTEISGPDGKGGQLPIITRWSGEGGGFEGDDGRYSIVLTGVEFAFIPAPGALGLLAMAGLPGSRRRRRH